jgi:hypothetical protein
LQGAGWCTVGTVGKSVGGEYVGGRVSVVTGWGRIRAGGKSKGREWMKGSERVVERENSGL